MLDLQRLVHDWTKGRFVMDSGHYAGRLPTKSDLNSPILQSLYDGIKKELGVDAAKNFVRFVNKLDDLSASSFIVAFERFCAEGCKVVDIKQYGVDRNRVTGYGAAGEMQAFAVIAEALGGRKRSEDEIRQISDDIKYQFILSHQKEIPSSEKREMRSSTYSL
jgi:hypothetical protein